MADLIAGGEAVVAALEALGVRCVFGVPSQQNLALYDALSRSSKISALGFRNEAGATHAADGYARATGKIGVVIASTGPGTTNTVTGLYEAGFASSPVLLITTQIARAYLGRSKAAIHDAEGQFAMLQSVTRRTERVLHGVQIYDTIMALSRDILSGRPQPGAIEIPTDLLSERFSLTCVEPVPVAPIQPSPASIDTVARLLGEARRPLVWVGGGCVRSGADVALRRFVEHLGAPVISTPNGRSALPTDHPLMVGSTTFYPAFRQLLDESDLVLAIGTRFQALATANWSLPLGRRLVQIDVDPMAIGRNYPVAAGIVGDAAVSLESLRAAIPGGRVEPAFLQRAKEVRADMLLESARRTGPAHCRLCDIVDEVVPNTRHIVCDATLAGITWGTHRLPIRNFGGFTYSTSLAIGVALPLALGVAIGSGRRTIALHGDGGLMLNIGELATAVETKAPLTLLVFNNRSYGVLKLLQKGAEMKPFAVDLHTPDFVGIGRAMGMPAERVDNPEDFRGALQRSVALSGPSLIEIDLSSIGDPGR